MRITTCNVNGVRAAARKGMGQWVEDHAPDVLLLQEVRAPEGMVADLLPGSWTVIERACEIKGRSGVAICLRPDIKIISSTTSLPGEEPVDTGRWVEVTAELGGVPVTLISAYLHSGTATDEVKMAAKYRHLDMVSKRLDELADEGVQALMCGDFNIVRGPADIKNFKPNHNKTSGVLDPEIAYIDRWFSSWRDVHRELAGEVQGPYTWWSQRGKAFDNDAGWRIDYQMATPQMAHAATRANVGRAASYDERWSDHAPLTIDYDLDVLGAQVR
ncbi:MAG: exodeoxyribonuclease III [Flaviflexus sp.]|nr:exodeoxyribonuclease III [Flaviflexus sp.]